MGYFFALQMGAIQDGQADTNACRAFFHPSSSVSGQLAVELDVIDFIEQGAKGNPWQGHWPLRKPA
jgi:hypothetical protein